MNVYFVYKVLTNRIRALIIAAGYIGCASVGSRDKSQGRWEWPVAVVWLPDFVARLVRQVRLIPSLLFSPDPILVLASID